MLKKLFGAFMACVLVLGAVGAGVAAEGKEPRKATAKKPVAVKVFIAAPFEIGKLTGDKAGEFQHWYERYFATNTRAYKVPGVEGDVFVNKEGVMGAVLGMGKVRSSSTMTAILADPRFDFSKTYFIITGCAGTPPEVGTVAAVFWADHLVDFDLGHRWAAGEVPAGDPLFSLRKGYEDVRAMKLNPALVARALELTKDTPLNDSDVSRKYRQNYPQEAARRAPFVGVGTHVAGDTFFHGPGLSKQAQYVCDLNNAGLYTITEMEGMPVAFVLKKSGYENRLLSLRTAVNFDQGHPGETTLQHLDPAPGNYPGGFDTGIRNAFEVGSRFVDHVLANWDAWSRGEFK